MNGKLLTAAVMLTATTLANPAIAEDFDHIRQLLATKQCEACDLSSAGLRLAKLTGANLKNADLSLANLDQANLSKADLSNANLSGAVLFRVNLSNANLQGANLMGANLSGAYLANADLSGANLTGANLSGAILSNVTLAGTILDQVNLMGAVGIPAGVLRIEDYYLLAFQEARSGNHSKAFQTYNQALQLNPKFAAAYLGRGVSRLQLGDSKGAMTDWQIAEALFTEQGNNDGTEISQQFIKAMKERQRASRPNTFLSIVNSLAPLLLKFIGL